MEKAGAFSVGSTVYIQEYEENVEYIVVHQGLPSSIYDSSCQGTWLMRAEAPEIRGWISGDEAYQDKNYYEDSALYSYLNGLFLPRFQMNALVAMNAVKIPYRQGYGKSTTINQGADGLTSKVFCLSAIEMGGSGNYLLSDGVTLDYFSTGTTAELKEKRLHYYSGSTFYGGWTRSPYVGPDTSDYANDDNAYAWYVDETGVVKAYVHNSCTVGKSRGIRPCFVLDPDFQVDSPIPPNSAPTTPQTLNYPSPVKGGTTGTISWASSTDVDGNLEGYLLECSFNSGSYSQVYKGSALSTTHLVPFGTLTVQYRVCAYDSEGESSDYFTSSLLTVMNNTPPKISGTDENLGEFSTNFTYNYTVTDEEGGVVTVEEKVDEVVLQTFPVTLDTENTFTFDQEQWVKLGNGEHTLTLTATDSEGETASRNLNFSKAETQIHLQYLVPYQSESFATVGILTIKKEIPEGASFLVEVCNNGFDDEPTWENVTSAVNLGGRFYLNNSEKTAENWGFNVRVQVDRLTAVGDCWVSEVSGYFR